MSVFLFPVPRKHSLENHKIDFHTTRWIHIDPSMSSVIKHHAHKLSDTLSTYFEQPLSLVAGEPKKNSTFLSIALENSDAPPQGYMITINDDGITLRGSDEPGIFYGLQTLQQLIMQTGTYVPAGVIEDYPDFPSRGFMLDISRCKVPSMDSLRKLIDMLAAFKINQLQLYMEHTFAFSAHREVWHDASPMTAEEIVELDSLCKQRFIELVPNFNSFGHFERWLRHPEYRHLAELPDGVDPRLPWGSMLKPDNQSLSFLDSLYRELLPNFSSSYFNVGCDETWELGQGWSKPLCEQKGKVRVYLDFLCGINELVSRHGRKMMFWGDIILHEPALIKELPHNLIALNWGYEADHDFDKECPLFAASNIAFYVCPGTSSWGSLTGRTGNCLANLANAAEHGLANKAIGYLNTDWGDRGHHQHLPISYPGILGGAAYSWCFQSNRHPDIRAAMNQFIFEDDTGNLGKSIDALGKVMDLIPRYTPNCTIFNRLLTWDLQSKREDMLKDLTVQNLSACIEQFDAIEQDLATACPRTADGELVKAEIRNNLAMARHGVRRGLAVIEGLTDLSQLRSELQNIIGDFEHLWLNRNRPGGLHESSGYLRNALETVGGFDK